MISKFIQKLREENNLSQEFMASQLGISRPTYIAIEKNQREITLEEAKSFAKIFNMTLDQFINEQEVDNKVDIKKTSTKSKVQNLRINVPQKNFEKFKEILLYVLAKVGAKPNIGETVLYKLLYFMDFDYYEKYEEQLMGVTYIKNHYGPTPVEFKKFIDEMIKDGDLEAIKSKYFEHDQKKYLAVRDADLSKYISAQELEHINEVLARLSDKNAVELSEYSHLDVPWIITQEGKPIDYESVFYRTPKTSVRNYAHD
jgi:transcriptional regulator with XRE-family HTH domain